MIVEIDDKSGFCFGVVTAIDKAEQALKKGVKVYSLGDIVHNKVEMARLGGLGLETVRKERIPGLAGETVLIRAHGEPPSTYALAERYGVRLVDATCPVVASLQRIVKDAYRKMQEVGGQVVILGKRGHAEVVGLNGQIGDNAIVIENTEDLHRSVDFERPIFLLSQTTKSLSLFREIKEEIYKSVPADAPGGFVTIRDTICRQVSNRYEHLREFAARYDVVLFVSGKESSNGKALYDNCRSVNPRSYKIEDEHEIDWTWCGEAQKVGVGGATSTPKWLMEHIASVVRNRIAAK